MKVLLCLLSDQHVPNLLTVHHCKPDHLVLVESTQMKNRRVALHFLKAIELGGLDYSSDRCHIAQLDRVDDMKGVVEAIIQVHGRHPNANWEVNITGGNKLMALAAYDHFKDKGRLFYIERDRPRTLILLDNSLAEECQHSLTIAEFLAGYGYELRRTAQEINELEQRDRRHWETARVIAERCTGDDLFPFDEQQRAKARRKGIVLDAAFLNPLSEPVRTALTASFGPQMGDDLKLDKAGGEFVTGGWLEIFIWGLLDRHADALQIHDLQRGVKPYRPEDQEANDMDVAFMHDLALTMIECKSGKQDHGGASDIFYKVDSVVRQSRALKAKAMLATTSDFLFDKQRPGELKQRVKELSDLLSLRIVHREEIQALARDSTNIETVRKILGSSSAP